MIKASYSAEGDVLFIALGTRKPTGRQVSHEVAPHVTVDIDEAGRVRAIEFLCASEHFSDAELATVGSEPTWLSITEALADAATDGHVMEASTLRRLLIDGTILGKKDGPDWRVAWHSLANYLENRPKRGPKPKGSTMVNVAIDGRILMGATHARLDKADYRDRTLNTGGVMAAGKGGSRKVVRDAGSGKFVKKGEATRRPKTTVTETVKTKRKK